MYIIHNMTLRLFTFSLIMLLGAVALNAQFRGGVKIGINVSSLKGESETDAAGTALETTDNFTGFHIGPSFSYAITDRFGLRGELLYSKKGVKTIYDGPGFRTFIRDNNVGPISTTGHTRLALSVNHVNLDIPVSAYVRLGKVEFAGGVYASLLVQKVAEGALQYTWKNPNADERTIELLQNHNYSRDDVGEGDNTNTVIADLNGGPATLPQTVGAYYDYPDDRGNLYKTLDYGLIGGASYYFTSSLFIGARLQYGLADLTRNEADLSKQSRNTDGTPITRADNDRNFTIQASVGFSF